MKPIGNVVGHLDLSKPVTQEQIIRALKDSRKGPALRDAFKAGYHTTRCARPPLPRPVEPSWVGASRSFRDW